MVDPSEVTVSDVAPRLIALEEPAARQTAKFIQLYGRGLLYLEPELLAVYLDHED